MRYLILYILIALGSLPQEAAAEDRSATKAVWLTGEVFSEGGALLFRAKQAVAHNSKGRVVLLGTSREAAQALLPIYGVAAEKHARLRLYGELLPFSGTLPGHPAKSLPSVQFITWKVHAPGDPDELPAGQKFVPRPGGGWEQPAR